MDISLLSCKTCGLRLRPKHESKTPEIMAITCPNCHTKNYFQVDVPNEKGVMETSTINFTVDGQKVTVPNPDPSMSLNQWLRAQPEYKGTKKSCEQGGCGCCVVMLSYTNVSTGQTVNTPANSCLHPLCATDGMIVTTIQGIGSRADGYDEIQTSLAQHNGTQCGYCSPGMVMSMYSLTQQKSKSDITPQDIELSLDGNICRCTGYRPILEAFKSVVSSENESHRDVEDTFKTASTPCQQLSCAENCKCRLKTLQNGMLWIRPISLQDLQDSLKQYKDQPYMLVCGNTSTGIFGEPDVSVKIDVSRIKELLDVTVTSSKLTVGSSVTLASLLSLLESNVSKSEAFNELVLHLKKVANSPVRGVASWAGNLMLAQSHDDFPSDVFTMMSGIGASINILDAVSGSSQSYDLMDFLSLNMNGKIIVSLDIPVLSATSHFKSFKGMLRHVNCHAYVNASFLIPLQSGTSKVSGNPRLIFGGINKKPVSASTTAAAMQGLDLSSEANLRTIMASLAKELVLDDTPASASSTYRLNLAQSFLYKAILSLQPSLPRTLQSASTHYVRPESSGQQSFQSDPSEAPVSNPIPKLSGQEQTSGEAVYIDDIELPSNTLHAAFVCATQANATLENIDASAITSLQGVKKVLYADDLPKVDGKPFSYYNDEPLLVQVGDTVQYHGQAIAIVVAVNAPLAAKAASMVKATYKSVGAPVLDLDDAIKTGSYFNMKVDPVKSGEDINKALSECVKTVSGSVSCGSQYHFHMATQECAAVPVEDGGMTVYSGTQSVMDMQHLGSIITGLPANKVRVQLKRMGGAYGGKIDRSWFTTATACFLSNNMHCPVKCVLPLETNMRMVGKRHPMRCDYTVGVDASNKLHAIKMLYYVDGGAYSTGSADPMFQGMTTCDNSYYCPNWDLEGKQCKTNTPAHTACRAPGCTQAAYFIESVMEHLAGTLNMAPEEFRRNNVYQQNQVTPYGTTLKYCSIGKLLDDFTPQIDFAARKQAVEEYNAQNRWRKRGISLAPNKYGLGWDGYMMSAHVAISAIDGTVSILHSTTESGQGSDVKCAQVAALTLGIDISTITVEPQNTTIIINTTTTGGSSTSEITCMAIQDACKQINDRLQPVKQKLGPNASWKDIITEANSQEIDLAARGWSVPTHPGVYLYNSYGVICNEVEIDTLTGEIEILRSDILFDCGVSLNPAIDIGQVEGAYVMGLGYFLTEQIRYDANDGGSLIEHDTWEYKPPSVSDIPIDFRITLLPDAPNPSGFLRSKASGEPPMCMSSNIVSAIRMAVNAARVQEAKKTAYFDPIDAPVTPDKIQNLCLSQASMFNLS